MTTDDAPLHASTDQQQQHQQPQQQSAVLGPMTPGTPGNSATPAATSSSTQRGMLRTSRPSFESFLNRPILHIKDNKQYLVVGMVGLPARGKSYIAKKIARYLQWLGYQSRIFNLGQYRRHLVGKDTPADYFDPSNTTGTAQREEMARMAAEDLLAYFARGGQAAIYDATNSNVERRDFLRKFLKDSGLRYELIWVESICDDKALIEATIKDTKRFSPDYQVREYIALNS